MRVSRQRLFSALCCYLALAGHPSAALLLSPHSSAPPRLTRFHFHFHFVIVGYANLPNPPHSGNAKVAELCSAVLEPPDLPRAAEIYERLGKNCLESALVKFNAKNHFLSCIFCLLAMGDSVAARQKLDLFGNIDASFRDSREGSLCDKLVQAVDDFGECAPVEYKHVHQLLQFIQSERRECRRRFHEMIADDKFSSHDFVTSPLP